MERLKAALTGVRRFAPLVGVLGLAAKTVLVQAGANQAYVDGVDLLLSVFGLGVVDGDLAVATVAGVGAIYKVFRLLKARLT